MEKIEDVFSLGKYGLKIAESKGEALKCAEIFATSNNYINIEVEENSIKNNEVGSDEGISIRVINRCGSLGFAFTNKLEKNSVERMVSKALKMMNSGTNDPDFKDLPISHQYPKIKGLFDADIKSVQIEECVNYVQDLIDVCKKDELAISQSANFASSYSTCYIFNTNGLEASDKETSCSISSNIIVKDPISKETAFGYDSQAERKLKNLHPTEIASNALKEAKLNLTREKIKSKKVPLILTPNATISLILSPIASAVNAEAFQYKRSFLVGKLGEKIGTDLLIIEDNALIDGAVGSSAFDGEGFPCKNKKLIEKGIFLKNGLLHNSYTAGKEGVESTGNASRKSYSSVPSIGISNFLLKPGDYSKDEMIKEIKDGILFDYTGDSPNISTGDFSGLILHGNVIKNGEIKEALNETMFGINLLDLFKKVKAVSKEFKIYGSYMAPYVRIESVQIIGSGT